MTPQEVRPPLPFFWRLYGQEKVDGQVQIQARVQERQAGEREELPYRTCSWWLAALVVGSCVSPIRGYRGPGGRVSFSPKGSFYDLHTEVACGQCIECRLERSRQWATRIVHEASLHDANSFITLTYSDLDLPSDGSLDVRDWQLFAKRLRKRVGPFRYFHCGEYGSVTERPHYHACLFGVDFADDRVLHSNEGGNDLYVSRTLEEVWGKGFTMVGEVSFESAAYVARYCTKKVTGERAKEHYEFVDRSTGEVIDRKPEYATMSRRPGVGRGWLDKYSDQVYPRDEVVMRGKRCTPPRYYDAVFGEKDPETLAELKRARKLKAVLHKDDQTPERLRVREKVRVAEYELFSREPGSRRR